MACIKDSLNLRVHLDGVFLLSSHLVSLIHQPLYPMLELIFLESVDYIGHIWSGQVFPFSQSYGKGLHHFWVLLCPLEHRFHLQAFEVRYSYVLHFVSPDPCPCALHQVSKVVDGVCLIAAQVAAAVMGEEPEHLALALVFGTKALSIHWYGLTKWICSWLLWLILHSFMVSCPQSYWIRIQFLI